MRNPYPIHPILKRIIKVWMTFFTRYYRIKANITGEVKYIQPPYLLIGNHVGRYDPFIQSHFLATRPNFVSSDAVLRDKIIGTLFKKLGAMPKRKGTRDSQIIREMRKVTDAGGAIALFPEGARTWSGTPLDIDISIVKLIRLLKIPVITAKMQGSYQYDPRWAAKIRRCGFEIDYHMLLKADEIKQKTDEEIYRELLAHVAYDDIAYQQTHMRKIESEKRAENIELVLFACPKCESYSGFHSSGNQFSCNHCDLEVAIDAFGFFSGNGFDLPFNNTRDWMNWQNTSYIRHIFERMQAGHFDQPFFTSVPVTISFALGYHRLKPIGEGTIAFFADRLEIYNGNKTITQFWEDVDMISPQYKDRLELTNKKDEAYRFTSKNPFEAGIKWELALNAVRYFEGKHTQLSAHFIGVLKEAAKGVLEAEG